MPGPESEPRPANPGAPARRETLTPGYFLIKLALGVLLLLVLIDLVQSWRAARREP